MEFDALDFAKWFLIRHNIMKQEQEDEQFTPDPITHLKLQKLLYYAQGVYAGLNNRKLFKNAIVAWDHGPVVRDVFEKYRGNKEIEFEPDVDDLALFRSINSQKEMGEALEAVYDHYGKFSAWYLRNKTHEERPWKETPKNDEIDFELIKEYFLEEELA